VQKKLFQPHTHQIRTLPFLATTDHQLPQGRDQIRGSGVLFSQMVLDAVRSGGIWIMMQDYNGVKADRPGDIVTFAQINTVDWLSGDQIQVNIELTHWGKIDPVQNKRSDQYLTANPFPLWQTNQTMNADDRLVVRLKQWQVEYAHLQQAQDVRHTSANDPCWLCWRWLELLPLPICTKQKLLKKPGPSLCLRYIKKMIHQSDRYTGLLR